MNPIELQQVKAELSMSWQMHGRTCPDEMLVAFGADVAEYTYTAVIRVMIDIRRTLPRPMTIADVISRLDGSDGRPGHDAAWALCPKSDRDSAVWTDEIAYAFAFARPLLPTDETAARMAFREIYIERVRIAREKKIPVRWWPSLGYDPSGRDLAVKNAIALGRLPPDEGQKYLPPAPAASAAPEPKADPESVAKGVKDILAIIERNRNEGRGR